MLLDQKIFVPVTTEGSSQNRYRLSGYLEAAPSDKILVRFNPENKPDIQIRGLTRTKTDGWYTYLKSDREPTYFSVEARFPEEIFGDMTVTIERWSGNSPASVYFEDFPNSPKLLFIGNWSAGRTVSEHHRIPLEYVSNPFTLKVRDASIFDAVITEDCEPGSQWATEFAREHRLPLFVFNTQSNQVNRVDGDEAESFEASPETLAPLLGHSLALRPINRDSGQAQIESDLESAPSQDVVSFHGFSPIHSPLTIDFGQALSAFRVSYRFISEIDPGEKGALISFVVDSRIENWNGANATPPLPKSPHKQIGHYRYISPSPIGDLQRLDVRLPPGVHCRGLTFRQFGNWDCQMAIGDISVSNLADSLIDVNR